MSRELARFADRLAARSPAPGAGSAAAGVITMAAALTEMAARFSDDPAAAARAEDIRARAPALVEEDARAYSAVLASSGTARQEALSRAADVPLSMAETAQELRALAAPLLESGNPNLRGEVLAALELASAGARAAAHLVLLNLGDDRVDGRVAQARALLD